MGLFSGPGLTPSLKGNVTNRQALQAGQVFNVPGGEAGWYMVRTGKYTSFQSFDPITGIWGAVGGGELSGNMHYVYMDGTTIYRFANQTGCVVGALLTNAGTGYTSPPTVTATGGSIWKAIVGGAVSATVTVSNGGVSYTYPPNVLFSPPPSGGIQAEGYCTLSGGAVSTVTITNQGAGYTSPPTIAFVNDSREGQNGIPIGYNAAAVAALTGSGTVTGLLCLDHGTPQTSVPTLTFAGGGGASAAATAIMCWSITAYAAGTAGAGLAGTVARITGEDAFPTTAAAYTNPSTQSGLVKTRSADIKAPISGAGITATGQIVYDGGIYTSVPTPLVIPTASIVTTAPVVTFTMGGINDGFIFTPV